MEEVGGWRLDSSQAGLCGENMTLSVARREGASESVCWKDAGTGQTWGVRGRCWGGWQRGGLPAQGGLWWGCSQEEFEP